MDPRPLGPEQWEQIGRLVNLLYLFTGLGLTAAFAFLLGHAVVPSLVGTGEASAGVARVRWVLYPVFGVAAALGAIAFGWAVGLAVDVLRYVYPRFLI